MKERIQKKKRKKKRREHKQASKQASKQARRVGETGYVNTLTSNQTNEHIWYNRDGCTLKAGQSRLKNNNNNFPAPIC